MYAIYTSGDIASKSAVPAWILALGGGGIVLGLALWGYHIIWYTTTAITISITILI